MTEPQTEYGKALVKYGAHASASDLVAIERQAADAALAGLAETVAGLHVSETYLSTRGSESIHVDKALSREAVLDAIATARKETK